jgi:hypothetical protein
MTITRKIEKKRPTLSIPFGGKRISFANKPPAKPLRDSVAYAAALEVLG